MRQFLKFAPLAGAALLVAACGGASTNNTANATDAGNVVTNEPSMAPDMNAGMPADNNAMAAPAAPADANAAAPAANAAAGNNL
jgi:hypothetical protein